MKKLITTIALFFMLTTSAFAGGPVKLKKGEPAPYDGYLFTVDQEQQVRLDIIKLKYMEQQVLLKDNLILNYKDQIQFHILAEERYKTAWEDSEDNLLKVIKAHNRDKLLYTIVGIGLTVAAGFALGAAN